MISKDVIKRASERPEFTEKRYLDEGPGKHEQEDGGATVVAAMFLDWADEALGLEGIKRYSREDALAVAKALYKRHGFGIWRIEPRHWKAL